MIKKRIKDALISWRSEGAENRSKAKNNRAWIFVPPTSGS